MKRRGRGKGERGLFDRPEPESVYEGSASAFRFGRSVIVLNHWCSEVCHVMRLGGMRRTRRGSFTVLEAVAYAVSPGTFRHLGLHEDEQEQRFNVRRWDWWRGRMEGGGGSARHEDGGDDGACGVGRGGEGTGDVAADSHRFRRGQGVGHEPALGEQGRAQGAVEAL